MLNCLNFPSSILSCINYLLYTAKRSLCITVLSIWVDMVGIYFHFCSAWYELMYLQKSINGLRGQLSSQLYVPQRSGWQQLSAQMVVSMYV